MERPIKTKMLYLCLDNRATVYREVIFSYDPRTNVLTGDGQNAEYYSWDGSPAMTLRKLGYGVIQECEE